MFTTSDSACTRIREAPGGRQSRCSREREAPGRRSATARSWLPPTPVASAFATATRGATDGVPPVTTGLLPVLVNVRHGRCLPNCCRNAALRGEQSQTSSWTTTPTTTSETSRQWMKTSSEDAESEPHSAGVLLAVVTNIRPGPGHGAVVQHQRLAPAGQRRQQPGRTHFAIRPHRPGIGPAPV